MYASNSNHHRRRIDPFNLIYEREKETGEIKFDRLPKRVRTKPLWYFIMLFMLVLIIYWYLNAKF